MEAKERIGELRQTDEGVSPVIAVILMVAITVVLAATVYVWVSGFASQDTGPEQAGATAKGVDLDDDGNVDWVKVTLTSGENAPYDGEDVTFSATDHNGADVSDICETAEYSSGCTSSFDMSDGSSDSWDVGGNLWVPCQGDGNHLVTVSVRDTAILDASLKCDAAA